MNTKDGYIRNQVSWEIMKLSHLLFCVCLHSVSTLIKVLIGVLDYKTKHMRECLTFPLHPIVGYKSIFFIDSYIHSLNI